jgi:hypothetical protein
MNQKTDYRAQHELEDPFELRDRMSKQPIEHRRRGTEPR